MTAIAARDRLIQLLAERPLAEADLGTDIDACRAAFVGLAVSEIASFRAQLSGPQVG